MFKTKFRIVVLLFACLLVITACVPAANDDQADSSKERGTAEQGDASRGQNSEAAAESGNSAASESNERSFRDRSGLWREALETAESKAWFERREKDKLLIRYFYLDSFYKSGDAILIQTPDGFNMLIDSGLEEVGVQVAAFLEALGVEHLDAVVNTHPHQDHAGGFLTVLKEIPADTVYRPRLSSQSSTFTRFVALLEEQGLEQVFLEEGDRFALGEYVSFEVLNPPKGTTPESEPSWGTDVMNNYSMVLRMSYGEQRFLFTADIYRDMERRLLEEHRERLDAHLLHAPHHGAMTSSHPDFIEAVQPEAVLLSANTLQSEVVQKRYLEHTPNVYSTAMHGHILIVSDGTEMNVHTMK